MTVTTVNEQGAFEAFDKTLAKAYENAWDFTNVGQDFKPKFKSASDQDVEYSWARTSGDYEIHFNQDMNDIPIATEEANGNNWQGMKTLVYVDIFTRKSNIMKLYVKEFNRITWDVLKPNGSTRIKKSNGTDNSAIDHFGKYHIQFIKERVLEPEHLPSPHTSGTIEVIWYKLRS